MIVLIYKEGKAHGQYLTVNYATYCDGDQSGSQDFRYSSLASGGEGFGYTGGGG